MRPCQWSMGAARRLAPQICRSFRRGFSGLATSGGSSSAQDRLCEQHKKLLDMLALASPSSALTDSTITPVMMHAAFTAVTIVWNPARDVNKMSVGPLCEATARWAQHRSLQAKGTWSLCCLNNIPLLAGLNKVLERPEASCRSGQHVGAGDVWNPPLDATAWTWGTLKDFACPWSNETKASEAFSEPQNPCHNLRRRDRLFFTFACKCNQGVVHPALCS